MNKGVDFKICSKNVLYHTYSLGAGLISFLWALYPFSEVQTSVSHIQNKSRHRTELFRAETQSDKGTGFSSSSVSNG